MFERVKAEAKYLRAGQVMDEEFVTWLAQDIKQRWFIDDDYTADHQANDIADSYLRYLYQQINPVVE